VADTCLGARPRLCLGSSSRADYQSGSGQSRETAVIACLGRSDRVYSTGLRLGRSGPCSWSAGM
jgi:hypothetical protein